MSVGPEFMGHNVTGAVSLGHNVPGPDVLEQTNILNQSRFKATRFSKSGPESKTSSLNSNGVSLPIIYMTVVPATIFLKICYKASNK